MYTEHKIIEFKQSGILNAVNDQSFNEQYHLSIKMFMNTYLVLDYLLGTMGKGKL